MSCRARRRLSLDARHADDDMRRKSATELIAHGGLIANRRGLRFEVEAILDERAVPMDPGMTERLSALVASDAPKLVSGAGHDAAIMATICPTAMLFIRSPGGISHHPDETVVREDVQAALDVIVRFLEIELDRSDV